MNLNGEILLGVDELRHERKAFKGLAFPAKSLSANGLKVLSEGKPLVLTGCNHALSRGMSGKLPAFGYRLRIALLSEPVPNERASPKIILKDGFQLYDGIIVARRTLCIGNHRTLQNTAFDDDYVF